jgi:periplasmic nitrate reductase NapD
MGAPFHITSLVVHSTPRRLRRVAERIAAMPGAQVHATAPSGKLVVTLDADSSDEMSTRIGCLQRIDGVLSAALVYQHAEDLDVTTAEAGHVA